MRVLAFSCSHAPFAHENALDFLCDLKRKYKPQVVVCLGDLGDQHGWSRHSRLPDAPGQGDELEMCRAWCHDLYKIFPKALACVGNHDDRIAKSAVRSGVPSALHSTIREIYCSPRGWRWDMTHTVDGILFQHGDLIRGGTDPAYRLLSYTACSVVIGHHHSCAGVKWREVLGRRCFACSAGCLVNPESYGLAYGKAFVLRPVLGAVIIIDGIPQFIPLT